MKAETALIAAFFTGLNSIGFMALMIAAFVSEAWWLLFIFTVIAIVFAVLTDYLAKLAVRLKIDYALDQLDKRAKMEQNK